MRKGDLRDSDGVSRQMRDAARDAARRSGMSLRDWLDNVVRDADADSGDESGAHDAHANDLSAAQPSGLARPERIGTADAGKRMAEANISQAAIAKTAGVEDAGHEAARISKEIAARIAEQAAARDARNTASPETGASRRISTSPAFAGFGAAPAWEQGAEPGQPDAAFPLRRAKPLDQKLSEADTPKIAPSAANTLPNFARSDMNEADRGLPQNPAGAPAMKSIQTGPQFDLADIQARRNALAAAAEHEVFSPLPQWPVNPHAGTAMPQSGADRPSTAFAASIDMFGLERHLRQITEQIESLARPDLTQAVEALRGELREIARTLIDAMPRREIEALEADIRRLSDKIDRVRGHGEGQSHGIDENNLATLETSLNEVRETLHALTPIENLSEVFETVHGLAQKIDRLGESRADPSALGQVAEAIAVLRGIISNVASNEALKALSDKVHVLGERIEQIAATSGGAETLAAIEKRILALTDTIDAHNQTRITDDIQPRLEAAIQGLSDKIDRVQSENGSLGAIAKLETRIDALADKLETMGARPGNLDTLERGLAEVLAYVAERREQDASGSEAFQRELARTQDSLEAVHETLSHVVDRLATLEQEKHARASAVERPVTVMAAASGAPAMAYSHVSSHARSVTPPSAKPMPPAPQIAAVPTSSELRQPDSPVSARAAAAVAAATRGPANMRPAIDPSLPPDHPLEPGASRGLHGSVAAPSAAERIAASEAALGDARTAPGSKAAPADAATKKNFIEAARRAAQAAAATEPKAIRPEPEQPIEAPAGTRLSTRIRTFLVGAAVILLIGGVVRVALNLVDSGSLSQPAAPKTSSLQAGADKHIAAGAPRTAPALDSSHFVPTGPNAASKPQAAGSAGGDVTGSIGQSSGKASGKAQDRPIADTAALDAALPPALGGKPLRQAAVNGDAGAEYEIGSRYAEGQGVPADTAKAADWLGRAAKKGVVLAQFRLGTLYEKGNGVPKNLATARSLYEQAAEKGNAKAMHNLAVLYAEGGDGSKPDYSEALKWFVKAANYGVSDSQYNLGILYARGIGVARNMVEAYKWFALAAAQGDKEAAKKQEDVAKKLDAKEMTLARTATESWVPQMQPTDAIRAPAPAGGWDQPATGYLPTPILPAQTAPVRLGSR